MMSESEASDLNKEVLEAMNDGLRYAYLSCGVEFQRQSIDKLASLHDRLRALRYAAIARSDEPHANGAFRAQMLVSGVKLFLEMWVFLKEDKPSEAWDKLNSSHQMR